MSTRLEGIPTPGTRRSPTLAVDDGVALVTFNRPEKMNAFDPDAYITLLEHLDRIIEDPAIRCAILTGAGDRAFTTGGDLDVYAAKPIEDWHEGARSGKRSGPWVARLNQTIWECPKPLIAAVNGYCAGWGMVALLSSDIRIAATTAKFYFAGALGIFGGGAAQGPERLCLQIAYSDAMQILLTNPIMTAQEAAALRIISEVLDEQQLMSRAMEIAERVKEMPPLAVPIIKGAVKRVYANATEGPHEETARQGREYLLTQDFEESLRAWAERRKPVWKGA